MAAAGDTGFPEPKPIGFFFQTLWNYLNCAAGGRAAKNPWAPQKTPQVVCVQARGSWWSQLVQSWINWAKLEWWGGTHGLGVAIAKGKNIRQPGCCLRRHFPSCWQFNTTVALCSSGAGAMHWMVFEVPQLPAKLKENTPSSSVLQECAHSNEFYRAQNPHTDFTCSFRSLRGARAFLYQQEHKEPLLWELRVFFAMRGKQSQHVAHLSSFPTETRDYFLQQFAKCSASMVEWNQAFSTLKAYNGGGCKAPSICTQLAPFVPGVSTRPSLYPEIIPTLFSPLDGNSRKVN